MNTIITDILRGYSGNYSPVVPFDPNSDRLFHIDLSAANTELTEAIVADTPAFSAHITASLEKAGARYGVGGYNELRSMYGRSEVFGTGQGIEPRRLHLGTDIWGKHGTKVMAPLPSIVHSFAFNNQFGDYGATIILSHNINGNTFYTLYGHLGLNSITNLQGGDRFETGETIGALGIPAENGGWPPHLHFQIILDIGNYHGDYPGVCAQSEKERWLLNSPDPDSILQMNQYLHNH